MQHYCIGSPDALLAKVIHQFLYRVHSKPPSRPNSHEDQAFSWLEKAYEERFNRLAYLKVEALWDPLRSDPRFGDLLRRVGIPP